MTSKPNSKILVKVRKWDENYIRHNGWMYSLQDCIYFSKRYEVEEAPLSSFNIVYESCCNDTMEDFAAHVALVNQANIKYPVLLAPCGHLIDGYHRMVKQIVSGSKTYKYIRLLEMPEPYKKLNEEDNQ